LKSLNLLSVKNLSISANNINILNDITFNLKKNQILGVVGESGSGKSITSLSIINLLKSKNFQRRGKVIFKGNRIDSITNKEFEKIRGCEISMIFQEPMSSLNPSMKCGYQVIETMIKHKVLNDVNETKSVLNLFEKVKLKNPEAVFNKYPHELSGGQQQRVMIAIAISCNPKILIADEPTTSLDAIVKEEIITLLKEIQKKNKMSIILVSHDLNLVSKIAHNLIVLNKGKIVEYGKGNKVFKNPQCDYTKMLLRSRPPKKTRPSRLPTIENNLKSFSLIPKKDRIEKHLKIYNQKPILKVDNLSFSYNEKLILNKVSFKLYKRETLGLVGESGSGKSTIAKSILKLINYKHGEIFYKNIDIKKYDKKIFAKNIQLIFQDPYSSLNPQKTIGKSILEPMIAHKIFKNENERVSKVFKLLEDVGLNKNDFNKYPTEFSGGQRQRIVIARALSLNPKILICDESVSALDVSVQAQVLNLLNNLREKFSFTFIFISHDLSVVKYMTDRIIVLNRGKIEEINETDKLFEDPHCAYTKKLLKANGY